MYQRALSIGEKSGGPYHGLTLMPLANIARAYAAQGDIANAVTFQTRVDAASDVALALDFAVGSEREKLAYLDSLKENTNRTISLHVNLAPNDRTAAVMSTLVILQRKGRVLDAMSAGLAALRQRAEPEDQKLLDQLKLTTEQLAKLALDGPQKMSGRESSTTHGAGRQEREPRRKNQCAQCRIPCSVTTGDALSSAGCYSAAYRVD